MTNFKHVRQVAVIVMIFFSWFILISDYSYAAGEESFEKKLQNFIQQGDYEGAINMLKNYISKVKDLKAKRKNLASAYYHLARTNFQAGLEEEVDINLKHAYRSFPALDIENQEQDIYFKERALKIKNLVIKDMLKDSTANTKTIIGQDKPVDKKVSKKQVIEKPAKKSKIKNKKKFPWLLVIGGLVVVGAVLYFLVLKKKDDPYDITGTWTISMNYFNSWTGTVSFWGSLTSGQCRIGASSYTGNYTVNGSSVEFDDGEPGNAWHWRGNFNSMTSLSGTMYDSVWVNIGTWTAIKTSVARKLNGKYSIKGQPDFKNRSATLIKKKI